MVTAAVVSLLLQTIWPKWNADHLSDFGYLIIVTVGVTTVVWLSVTLLTSPEPREKLRAFYEHVRPAGPGWKPVATLSPVTPHEGLVLQFANWLLGCTLVYASLFAIGNLIFREWMAASVCLSVAFVSSLWISRNLSRAES